MNKILRKKIKKTLKPIFNKLGFITKEESQIDNLNKNKLLFTFFNNLQAIGFTPKHIVDIGANHGNWTREALIYFPESSYTLVEPQERLKKYFQDLLDTNPKIKYFQVGAGQTNGTFKFTIVDRDDSCTFRIQEEEAELQGFDQIEIPVITLNDLIKINKLETPDIIKIDAEGLDLEVLKGASDFFGKTEVFMVEAALFNKEFDNSFLKTINLMDQNGYNLFDITDLNRPFKPEFLWLVELVFIKKGGIIDSFKIL